MNDKAKEFERYSRDCRGHGGLEVLLLRNLLWGHGGRMGNSPGVLALLDKGASPCAVDFEGKTALMHASGRGRLDCVNWLLERGAEVNAVDCKGVSALMEAANGCRDDCVEILLAAGADVCAADGEGRTALWFAVSKGDFKSTQALAAAHPEGLVGQAQWQMAHGLANMVGGGCLSAMEREFFLRCVGRAEELSAASV